MITAEMAKFPAYESLRPSVRRLLQFILTEIDRQPDKPLELYDDQLAVTGSRCVFTSGCRELGALGLIGFERHDKINVFTSSKGWRNISTKREALLIIARTSVEARLTRGRMQTAADGVTA